MTIIFLCVGMIDFILTIMMIIFSISDPDNTTLPGIGYGMYKSTPTVSW
ncbi:MAG: hypothetical protein R2771_00500 [Saprospiraceae bacterium]